MLQVVKVLTTAVAALLFASCDSLDMTGLFAPTGDTVKSRFESSMSITDNKSIATIAAEDEYLIYVCADPHIATTSENIRHFITQMDSDKEALLGIVLGDCTDKRNAMANYVEAIESDKPIFSIIGNHDLFFEGWNDFRDLVGPSVYWFTVGADIFIALDSASGTLGGKQTAWLKEFLTTHRANYRHCIILTHTNLFYTDNSQTGSGNMAMEETHALVELFSRHNVTLCLQGHDHYREDLTLGAVRYTIVGTIRDEFDEPEYLIIRLSNSGVEYLWREM